MRYLLVISAFILTISTDASGRNYKKHSWGFGYGLGSVINGNSRDDGGTLGLGSVFYEYHLNKNYGIHAKYNTGKSGANDRPDGEFDSSGYQLSFKAKTNITENFGAYGRIGANFYDSEVASGGGIDSSRGIGYVGALGLEVRTDNGFRFGLEAEYYAAGDIDVIGGNLFIGFSF